MRGLFMAMALVLAPGLGAMGQDVLGQGFGADITHYGVPVRHVGNGVFAVGPGNQRIDLRRIVHAHDRRVDPDVPAATDVTLDDVVPDLIDGRGQRYARITLFQVDPPLTGLPSREASVDRGTDFRDPANLVKGAYSNYVSPVTTVDAAAERVAGHPIGHFFVRVEIPGYPTITTGMTTIARADTELVDLTIGRELGIGGVLLTPQPGRLNSAAEVTRELGLRQQVLRVVDGLNFRLSGGRNIGPEFTVEDGRVVFARFRVPMANAQDAMAFFVEYVQRGVHNTFGSLLSRPARGTGAGCSAFAMAWLQAAGVIPFVSEPDNQPTTAEAARVQDLWMNWRSVIRIPWAHIGCDERVGAARPIPAAYTIYDLLFHGMSAEEIERASGGLAQKVRDSYGALPATLFQFGVFTPIRDLVINARRKDPDDRGDYAWARGSAGTDVAGLDVAFWDNTRFSDWVKRQWTSGPRSVRISLVREGRFRGVEVDAMQTPRQREPFFAAADRVTAARLAAAASGTRPDTCRAVFALGLQ